MELIEGKFYECKEDLSLDGTRYFSKGRRYKAINGSRVYDDNGVDVDISGSIFERYFDSIPYDAHGNPTPKEPEAQEDQPLEYKKPANILNLEVGKYYECKEPSKIERRHKFLVGHRYLADGKCHIIDENKNRIRIFRSEFKELFHNNPLDTSGETLYPSPAPLRPAPKAPDTQNLPKDPSDMKTLADEAYELIGGDRQEEYGDMRKSFENIGKVWSVLLGIEVSAEKVALMMVGLKMVRQNNKHKRDNLVDLIGYTALLGRLEGEE